MALIGQLYRWLGGVGLHGCPNHYVVIKTSDSRLLVAGSIPSHDRLFLRLVTVFVGYTILGYNHHPGQLSLTSHGSLNRVPASAGIEAGKSPLPGGRIV